MSENLQNTHDVIIAGAGPVGLFLACELRLAGCSVLVLEKARDPHSPLKALPLGLRGLNVPTVESFDRRGLLNDLKNQAVSRDVPAAAHWMRQPRRSAGHFAGITFFHDRVDGTQWPNRLPNAAEGIATDMSGVEAVLTRRAVATGVVIMRDYGVEAIEQTEKGVDVGAGGRRFCGRWLVGCDGGRSLVRKSAGIGFAGTDPELTGYSAQVVLADSEKLVPGRHDTATGTYTYAAPGTIAMVDFDGGGFHRTDPVTRDHLQAVLRKVSGTDVTITEVVLATTWTDRAFQASAYRSNRVLLAGDAAHVHSPLGGQGLNLGLGDAINLGWKLAATIRGDAPKGLLDSYERERQPIGARVLDWSRAQIALMRPSPASRALRSVVSDLAETRDGATHFAERVWGVGQRYDLGGGHPLTGRSAPDFELADGTRLNEHLRTGRGLVLDFGARASLRALATRWGDRIGYVASDARAHLGVSALLVRPDGMVAWASDDACEDFADAATHWFGEPQAMSRPDRSA
ncbi:FAD-dependent monooxygenase [Methylobacterium brachythecii]|uniref:FAD-dependent oxidoreductase n=1 Tax=Methylobacterium brachythecii TaxID=1176177 RepID=A0A7W6F5Z8_9HYPH|nr:FAD-dependent monooxygenase [Methylobacterium brachythecii]MBB3901834.1 2-polyprenyl-6-methoxyphenol hydroxylase-like FAD-dependent oxidoreductase [Methylobacterium brachythecii]GLS43213.1 FAD-dependent oxidoreductase [Methylobacterium brachythecii]